MDEQENNCERCGEDLWYAGSHYHCGNCTSTQVTSMLGHYVVRNGVGMMSCDPKDVIPGGNRGQD